jgi:hypothetical protein
VTRDELLEQLLLERFGARPPSVRAAPATQRPRPPVLVVLDDADDIAERRRVLEQLDHHERTA